MSFNVIAQWKLRYCKARMVAFINGELPEKARRRVGRYIDDCPACYDEYVRQRRALQDIQPAMRGIGLPRQAQLDRIWGNIQAEMSVDRNRPITTRPAGVTRSASVTRPTGVYHRTSYAVAMMVTILLIVVPFVTSNDGVSVAADTTQPQPAQRLTLAQTDAPEDNGQLVAAATAEPDVAKTVNIGATLEATPRPVLEPDEND